MMNMISGARFGQSAPVSRVSQPVQFGAGKVLDVTPETFQKEVLESDKPVLVDFWAPWCPPCKAMGPIVEQMANERSDVKIVKANTQDHPAFSQALAQLGLRGIPAFVVFNKGVVVATSTGGRPKAQMNAWVSQILSKIPNSPRDNEIILDTPPQKK